VRTHTRRPVGRVRHSMKSGKISIHLCIRKARQEQTPTTAIGTLENAAELPAFSTSSQYTRGLQKVPNLEAYVILSAAIAVARNPTPACAVDAVNGSACDLMLRARPAATLPAPAGQVQPACCSPPAGAINGSRISTISPPSARLKAFTFPPWKRTARSVMARPRPTPPVRRPRASSSR
jgi:hypothetical protein